MSTCTGCQRVLGAALLYAGRHCSMRVGTALCGSVLLYVAVLAVLLYVAVLAVLLYVAGLCLMPGYA